MTIFSEEQFSSQNLGADAAKVEAWPKTKLWNVNGKKLTRSKFSTEERHTANLPILSKHITVPVRIVVEQV